MLEPSSQSPTDDVESPQDSESCSSPPAEPCSVESSVRNSSPVSHGAPLPTDSLCTDATAFPGGLSALVAKFGDDGNNERFFSDGFHRRLSTPYPTVSTSAPNLAPSAASRHRTALAGDWHLPCGPWDDGVSSEGPHGDPSVEFWPSDTMGLAVAVEAAEESSTRPKSGGICSRGIHIDGQPVPSDDGASFKDPPQNPTVEPLPSDDMALAVAAAAAAAEAAAEESSTRPKSGGARSRGIHIDRQLIPKLAVQSQPSELQELGVSVYEQRALEAAVLEQVDQQLHAERRAQEALALNEYKSVLDDLRSCCTTLKQIDQAMARVKPRFPGDASKDLTRRLDSIKRQKENKENQIKKLNAKQKKLQAMLGSDVVRQLEAELGMEEVEEDEPSAPLSLGSHLMPAQESEWDMLVRTGQMTPFGTRVSAANNDGGAVTSSAAAPPPPPDKPRRLALSGDAMSGFEAYMAEQDRLRETRKSRVAEARKRRRKASRALDDPGPSRRKSAGGRAGQTAGDGEPGVKRKAEGGDGSGDDDEERRSRRIRRRMRRMSGQLQAGENGGAARAFGTGDCDEESGENSDSNASVSATKDTLLDPDWLAAGEDDDDDDDEEEEEEGSLQSENKAKKTSRRPRGKKGRVGQGSQGDDGDDEKFPKLQGKRFQRHPDDGDIEQYKQRVRRWHRGRLLAKKKRLEEGLSATESEESDVEFEGGFKVPASLWQKLYKYQQTGVQWLWELHVKQAGGILGDEMGLGKTVQIIAFLAGLSHSKLRTRGLGYRYEGLGPSLVVCPTTVMHQWVREFHTWWPQFRVAVLHESGSYSGKKKDTLGAHPWHYVILDEGHKIRNPAAAVTVACKQFRTPHRIILSGSPVQNNLKELWSLFDFVFPGKLGTLPVFMEQFSVPITQGGYSNASDVQVQTAYKCACVLRDTIKPFLLRRMKADVKVNLALPDKNEQVLFCRLTDEQRAVYQKFLDSREVQQVLNRERQVFTALITLRKICNHPDLLTGGLNAEDDELAPSVATIASVGGGGADPTSSAAAAATCGAGFGYWRRSGKLLVVEALLRMWRRQGHRVLLFTQSRQMLDILEKFVQGEGYSYMKMDGTTSIATRQPLIDKFNKDESMFMFLLTTHVGGIGVNLTGANRVIIFDPDWNPSTDTQARERAWRIGQLRQVTIYRLVSAGTIEEKIYHRQIFKQFLTNRVLKDPRQQRFFKANDLFELFALTDPDSSQGTETSALFAGTGSDVRVPIKPHRPPHASSGERHGPHNAVPRPGKPHRSTQRRPPGSSSSASAAPRRSTPREAAPPPRDRVIDADATNGVGLKGSSKSDRAKPSPGLGETPLPSRNGDGGGGEAVPAGAAQVTPIGRSAERGDATTSETSTGGDAKEDASVVSEDKMKAWREMARRLAARLASGGSDSTAGGGGGAGGDADVSAHRKRREKQKHVEGAESGRRRDGDGDEGDGRSKKKRKGVRFEGERIPHLVRHAEFKGASAAGGDKEEREDRRKTDDYVLEKLFKKSGIHSAMQHDAIMNSSRPDFALVEAEATRVARDAMHALRQSRRHYRSASAAPPPPPPQARFGQRKKPLPLVPAQATKPQSQKCRDVQAVPKDSPVPTSSQTPRFGKKPERTKDEGAASGSGGGTSSSSGGSTSSSSGGIVGWSNASDVPSSLGNLESNLNPVSTTVLARMRTRNHLLLARALESTEDGEDEQSQAPSSSSSSLPPSEFSELLSDLRTFVAFGGAEDGRASTQELLHTFERRVPPEHSPVFRELLRSLCTFERDSTGLGMWHLRPDYR
uniref:DNA excision repair protein ERCC-6 isoform X3 n=1 Tax=Petromyzon marinus TaxID=7757 RepID=A0AAJ7SUV8_PETMA|nr:DNA excision repair protein ERCC-6 isoform X3 [Petromyzon marinus]